MNTLPTILLVDDSENDLVLMRSAFKKAKYTGTLQVAHNGEEAIAYLTGEGLYGERDKYPLPAVMVLDLNMPGKNGFDVLAWVRAQRGIKRLAVIIMTASTRTEDVERALDLGATSYLVKPGNLETLTTMVRTLTDWIQINLFPPLR